MSLRNDDRGLALGVVVFFVMIVIAALLYMTMDVATAEVFAFASSSASHQGAQDQITMAETIWKNLLYAVLFLATIFIIARAVNEGSVGR